MHKTSPKWSASAIRHECTKQLNDTAVNQEHHLAKKTRHVAINYQVLTRVSPSLVPTKLEEVTTLENNISL